MVAITATGAATLMGTRSASSGTATSASPNPNDERMRVARKRTPGTRIDAGLATIFPAYRGIHEFTRTWNKPDVCAGEICATRTRIPVTVILDNLAEGASS